MLRVTMYMYSVYFVVIINFHKSLYHTYMYIYLIQTLPWECCVKLLIISKVGIYLGPLKIISYNFLSIGISYP